MTRLGSSPLSSALKQKDRFRSSLPRRGRAGARTAEELSHSDEVDSLRDVLRREQIYRRALALADSVAVLLSILVSSLLTGTSLDFLVALAPPFAILVAKLQGLYDRDDLVIFKSTLTELPRLLQMAAIVTVALDFTRQSLSHGPSLGLIFSLLLWLVMATTAVMARGVARGLARRAAPEERCLIIGDGFSSRQLGRKIEELRGVALLGTIAKRDVTAFDENLAALVHRLGAHRLVIATTAELSDDATLELIRDAKATGARVSIFPSILAAVGGSAVFDDLAGFTLLGVPRFGLSRSSAAIKRVFDFAGATIGLILFAPLMLISAALIKLDSEGPILFRQVRVGRDGRHFHMLKFRTMVNDAEALKAELVALNEAQHGLFKIEADPRVTRFGGWSRRTRFDELPQLLNVLRGEMSLVGPRPLILEEDARMIGHDRRRLHLTPGITGPWQVLGPMRAPLAEMAKLDYLYIANWSLWEDIRILLETAAVVAKRRGV